MKIENQVCSLEQAKKMKELGIIQESIFCFIGDANPDPKYFTPYEIYLSSNAKSEVGASWYEHRISAFTVAELGMIVGSLIKTKDINVPDEVTKKYAENDDDYAALFNPNLLADAIIYWLENKEITVEEINQRLIPE